VLEAAGEGDTVVEDVVVEVDPGAVSVAVVRFSQAESSAAAARTDSAAMWVRCAFTKVSSRHSIAGG
jgi:hypothetical protein